VSPRSIAREPPYRAIASGRARLSALSRTPPTTFFAFAPLPKGHHLLRKFVSFSERDGPASGYGKQMLQYTGIMFEMYYAYKDAKITREEFRRRMQPLREQFEALLQRAVDANIKGLSGSCADILYHREALWAFVDKTGIEPTNNHAEQQLRAFVLWRRRSFGTQSERGNRFAERIMTVVHTARKQGRHVLSYLTAVCEASRTEQPTPPLLLKS
jgi:transposase